MKKKAIIISIKGSRLTPKEKLLLAKERPWGLILFKRNIKSSIQTKKLIKSIRNYVKDKKFPILIDEDEDIVLISMTTVPGLRYWFIPFLRS